jgi:hypothetical protein
LSEKQVFDIPNDIRPYVCLSPAISAIGPCPFEPGPGSDEAIIFALSNNLMAMPSKATGFEPVLPP